MWSADGSGRSAATLTSSPKPSRRPVGSWITAWFWAWQLAGSTFHTRAAARKRAIAERAANHQPGAAAQVVEDLAAAEVLDDHAPNSAAALIAARMRW